MNLGYRVFFVRGESLQRISQRRFNELFTKRSTTLPEYADQTVLSVMVVYELSSRKPHRIMRIDTEKIRFDDCGGIDEDFEREGMRLAANKMNGLIQDLVSDEVVDECEGRTEVQNTVIDASERFDERRWSQRHPELSGPLLKKILEGVFGRAP